MEVRAKNKISWDIRDKIGYLHLIDPPENLMDSAFFDELHDLTSRAIPGSKPSAIIISGSGRHFSAGADLDDLMRMIKDEQKEEGSDTLLSNYQAFNFFHELNIPVIAAINGVCIGSALELVMHSHFRLCSEGAILGLPESTYGLMPGMGGIPRLLELAGKAKTMELVLRGNTVNTTDALKWNIVDAIYPKRALSSKAEQLAKLASINYRKYKKTDYLKILKTI